MSEACTHDCSNCHADCSSRAPQHEPPHAKSHIKKVIGVVSGKGGVGKSMTSAMMAVSMRRKGYKVGVLDADITGPSIPKLFGVHGPAMGTEDGINPVESHTGIKIMSINLLLEDEEAPVVWRGPVIAGAVKQFWQEVIWDDVDFLFVDMPPGTGDVPLTVFQTLPVDGIVTGCILAIGRIVGESAALLFTAGFAHALNGFFTGLTSSGATLTVALYVYAKEQGEFEVAFAIAAILMILTLIINLSANFVGKKLKRRQG